MCKNTKNNECLARAAKWLRGQALGQGAFEAGASGFAVGCLGSRSCRSWPRLQRPLPLAWPRSHLAALPGTLLYYVVLFVAIFIIWFAFEDLGGNSGDKKTTTVIRKIRIVIITSKVNMKARFSSGGFRVQ